MTHSTASQASENQRGSAVAESVLLIAPTVVTIALAVSMVLAFQTKIQAITTAALIAQRLASADASITSDGFTQKQISQQLLIGRLERQTIKRKEGSVMVCLRYRDVLGTAQQCWHSLDEPR
jgi:hypothetical protein